MSRWVCVCGGGGGLQFDGCLHVFVLYAHALGLRVNWPLLCTSTTGITQLCRFSRVALNNHRGSVYPSISMIRVNTLLQFF